VCTDAEVHGSIPELVDNIIPAVKKAKEENPGSTGIELVPSATLKNIFQSIEDLLNRSEEARKLIEEGELTVVGAVYDIENGSIKWLGSHPNQENIIKNPKLESSHSETKSEANTEVKADEPHDNPNVNLKFGFFLALAFLILAIPVTLITMILFDWVRKKL
jgi:hypothetical protein